VPALFTFLEVDEVRSNSRSVLRSLPRGLVIEHRAASELTCRSIFAVLERARPNVAPALLPQLRTAFDLATDDCTGIGDQGPARGSTTASASSEASEGSPQDRLADSIKGALLAPDRRRRARTTRPSHGSSSLPIWALYRNAGTWMEARSTTATSWRYVVDPCCIRFVDARRKCVDQGTHYWERSCFGASIAALKGCFGCSRDHDC